MDSRKNNDSIDKVLALMKKTGYNIKQENGQRIMGPPPNWQGPPPPKGCEIFIGKIPSNVYEDEIFPIFQKVGIIYKLRLIMHFYGHNKGIAFVTYTNKEDCEKAIKQLNNYPIRKERRLGVVKSVDSSKLEISGFPEDKTKEEIFHEISKYTQNVVDVTVREWNNSLSRCAVIKYESHEAASAARRVLIPSKLKLFNQEVDVEWADLEPEMISELLSLDTVLFVSNISSTVDKKSLFLHFSGRGELRIDTIKKYNYVAFVFYKKKLHAQKALFDLNGTFFKGKTLEVTFMKTDWAIHYIFKFEKNNYQQRNAYPTYAFYDMSFKNLRCSPTQLLSLLCCFKNWGDPEYQVKTHKSLYSIGCSCQIFIPNYPDSIKYVASSSIVQNPFAAKFEAAENALSKIYLSSYLSYRSDFPIFPPPGQKIVPYNLCTPFHSKYNYLKNHSNFVYPEFVSKSVADEESISSLELLASAVSIANIQLQAKSNL